MRTPCASSTCCIARGCGVTSGSSSTAGAGVLWGYVGASYGGARFAGSIGGQNGGPNALVGQVIVAPYAP